MNLLEVTDKEAASKAVSPTTRVALADIEANISCERYLTGAEIMLGRAEFDVLTACFISTKNGFIVIGKSAPADPANFNPELGRKFAREDAIRQLWPLMGYALRERIRHGW